MTRPTRNLLIFAAVMLGVIFGASHLPPAAVFVCAGVLTVYFVVCLVVGREFFVGRRRMKQKRWEEAAICFVHFEQRLQSAKWRQMSAALFSGMYTYDGIAIARNNLGVVRLEQGRFSEAEAALRRAIERDTLYAMPYVNLAIIAALAGNATQAEQEQARAHALGFRDRGLQKRVRKLLARTNTTVGAGR